MAGEMSSHELFGGGNVGGGVLGKMHYFYIQLCDSFRQSHFGTLAQGYDAK